jgi:hypothetical protein
MYRGLQLDVNLFFFFKKKDEFIHLADPYPQIPAVCIGPQYEINRTEMIGDPEIRKDMTKMFPFMLKIITSHLEKGNA